MSIEDTQDEVLGITTAALILCIDIASEAHGSGVCHQVQKTMPRTHAHTSTMPLLLRAMSSATVCASSCFSVQSGALAQRHRHSGALFCQLTICPQRCLYSGSTCTHDTTASSRLAAHRPNLRRVWPGKPHPTKLCSAAAACSGPCSCLLQIPRHSFLPLLINNKSSPPHTTTFKPYLHNWW
ncbi:hypothetical protein CC86DRAFT_52221 [Ophiobolus disseminans]|uniref:Uncharacterized protein n=1 Tax=Ophiobolus disseminans TaxID=1469910 RepID=A0A6A6ZV66_9PLEO|nr:hypothetical protein CC86DRAFT_52221 [Ophiobolus disseminans]